MGLLSAADPGGGRVWWLLGRREKLTAEQAAYLERLTTLRPPLALARELVQEFFSLTRRRDVALKPWRARVAASGMVELQHFSTGLQRDWDAVGAGLMLLQAYLTPERHHLSLQGVADRLAEQQRESRMLVRVGGACVLAGPGLLNRWIAQGLLRLRGP